MKLLFLGTAQDAGIPQIGCLCQNCQVARNNKKKNRLGPSVAILDNEKEYCYLFDASPDIKEQIELIRQYIPKVQTNDTLPITGIFITHAHYGHVAGLWSLGKECVDAKEIITFCSRKMSDFLKNNHPFQHLFQRKNLTLFSMKFNHKYSFNDFRIKSLKVPHRDEFADTAAYIIYTEKNSVLYIPDIDNWTDEIIQKIHEVDIAIIDGSFYTKNEITSQREVPHPPITESIKLLDSSKTKIFFTHFNHTNTILNDEEKKKKILDKGFDLAEDGLILEI